MTTTRGELDIIGKSTTVRVIRATARIVGAVAPGVAARWLERRFLTPLRWRTPAREVAWMQGATYDWLRLDATRRIRVASFGAGPAVLLVHGWAGRGSQMGGFVAPLLARGFRVITFDAPGHGASDGRLSGLPAFALAIQAVAAWAGPVHAIVAHSMGCAATTVALARRVDVGRVLYVASPENPGDYLFRLAHFLGVGPRVAARAQARIERRFGLRFVDARAGLLAPGLAVPLLAVHDRDDDDVPHAEGVRLVQRWPGARLVTTQGLGHTRILRDPGVVAVAVDFADEAPARAAEGATGRSVRAEVA